MSDITTLDRTATSQHGVLTYDQLRAAGVSHEQIRYRVKTGRMRTAARRVYALAGSPSTYEQTMWIASLAAQPLGALSHRTAAKLWGFRTVDDDVDVTVRYPRKLTIPGVRVCRSRDLEANDITWVNGCAATTPERTICDLGLIFPDHEVQRILDHAIATGSVNRREVEQLRRRISERGRDGAGSTRRCLALVPAHAEIAESGPEVAFLRMCEEHNLPIPALQQPVIVDGRSFRVDFAYPVERVFVEIDGRATHSENHQIANDGGRQNLLVADGWTPLRFMYDDLRDHPAWCASTLRKTLNL